MASDKTLIVMRHAKSSWKTNEPDFRRPLSPRGTRDAVVAGQGLADVTLDVALVSGATRTQQTWKCLEMGGITCEDLRVEDDLYNAWTRDVLLMLRQLPEDARTVLVLGHEPTMSDLVINLAVDSPLVDQVREKYPTSAISVLHHDKPWHDLDYGDARLAEFAVPRG